MVWNLGSEQTYLYDINFISLSNRAYPTVIVSAWFSNQFTLTDSSMRYFKDKDNNYICSFFMFRVNPKKQELQIKWKIIM